ncbi:MAG: hypothetical protein AAF481_00245 [Acidobacteriota bacterium]
MKKLACWMIVALFFLPAGVTLAEKPRPSIENATERQGAVSVGELWADWLRRGLALLGPMIGRGQHGPLIDPNGRALTARDRGSDSASRDRPIRRGEVVPDSIGEAGQHGPLIDPNGVVPRNRRAL